MVQLAAQRHEQASDSEGFSRLEVRLPTPVADVHSLLVVFTQSSSAGLPTFVPLLTVLQVHKAYLHNEGKFVAVKRINIMNKVTPGPLFLLMPFAMPCT